MIDDLSLLAIRHGTDKFGPHLYTPHYHALFGPRRHEPLKLLEIGVGGYGDKHAGGASLRMWHDYFSCAAIVGVDVEEKVLDLPARVTVRRGSQDDASFLRAISRELGPFDIVIDDGSHVPAHVAASFQALFPLLPAGAIYVVEDVQTAFWDAFGGDGQGSAVASLWHTLLRAVNRVELLDDDLPAWAARVASVRALHNLLVVDKGADDGCCSNIDWDPHNPHARAARALVEEQHASAPSPGSALVLSMMRVLAGEDVPGLLPPPLPKKKKTQQKKKETA